MLIYALLTIKNITRVKKKNVFNLLVLSVQVQTIEYQFIILDFK